MTFDPQSPDFLHNPYPTYDRLRSTTPIFYDEKIGMWFFTTHDDVSTLLKDRRLGRTMEHIATREELGLPPKNPAYAPFHKLSAHSMFDKEPPDHTRLRALVHKVFTPKRVENLRAKIQAITDGLLDAVEPDGQMDLIADFAATLPVVVIAELLGVPEEDQGKLRPWSADIVAMYELNHTPETARRAVQAATEFSDYLIALARQRRAAPKDDLITALALVEEQGDTLTEDELVATCVLLLNAGHEATVNVLGNGLWALLQHPDQLAKLKANPALVPTAVEELLRYDTPLQLFRRWVLQDIEYKGHSFQKGEEFALLFGSANRDPARFDHADQLDVAREDNPHVSFSLGIHYCLGAPLARMELQIALATLLRRMPNLRLAGDAPEFKPAYVIRGLKDLKLAF